MTSRPSGTVLVSRRRAVTALPLSLFCSSRTALFAAETAHLPPIKVCVSDRVLNGVNINDAKASLRVWSQEIIANSSFQFAPDLEMILPTAQLLQAIRAGTIDLMCLTIEEYMQVRDFVDPSTIVVNEFGGISLVLVVNADRGIDKLADLRGRSLQVLDIAITGLAIPWLTVSLRHEGLPGPAQLLSRLTRSTKLAQVVLPVYFGQTDACIVTREGLATMTELNPQLSRKLKILRTSPAMFATVFACRRGLPPAFRAKVIEQIVAAKKAPAAKQLLTLFHSPGYSLVDAKSLLPAIQLLEAFHRIAGPEGNISR